MICPLCGLPLQPILAGECEGWYCDPALRHCQLSAPLMDVISNGVRAYPVSYRHGCGYTYFEFKGNQHAPP